MKKLILGLFLALSSLLYGQDIKPTNPEFYKLQTPNNITFWYNPVDSFLWAFKGQDGWTRIANWRDLAKYKLKTDSTSLSGYFTQFDARSKEDKAIRIPINDIDYTVTSTVNTIIGYTNVTTRRVLTLPPATIMGQTVQLLDENGVITPINRIVVQRQGTDLLDGDTKDIEITPYTSVVFTSNGSGKWLIRNRYVRQSAGVVISPSYVDHGDGSVTIGGNGLYNLFREPDGAGIIRTYEIADPTITLVNGSTNYIVANYNSGTPIIQSITDVSLINETTIIPIMTIYRGGNRLHLLPWKELGLSMLNKIHQSIIKTQRYRLQSGLGLGESAGRVVTLTEGIVWVGANSFNLPEFNSTSNQLFFLYHSGGVWQTPTIVTQYNNTQYDDGTGLQTLNPNKYAVNFIYRGVELDDESYMVLGQGNYTLLQAQASLPPANLPALITSHAILVGRIIVEQAATTAYEINSIFSAAFALSNAVDHNDLSGLQGGTAGQYYHMNLAQHTIATQEATNLLAGYVGIGTQTFGGIKTFTLSPLVPTATANDNSTKAASTAYVDAKVADIITDGVTTIAPSENAVSDALALKTPLTLHTDIKDPSGFIDGNNINVSYNWTNRTITLTGVLDYYWNGVKKTLASPWTSTAHTATVGAWFLSSSDGTNFTWSQTPWSFNHVMVSYVNYKATLATTLAIRETHGIMPWNVHEELHTTIGTYLLSGGKLTAGTYSENVGSDVAVTPSFDVAVVKDEDNETTIPSWIQGTYTTMYIGAASTSVFNIANTKPFVAATGAYLQVNNTTTGIMTPAVTARYYNVYQILIPTTSDAGSSTYRTILLQPQATYTSLVLAQGEDVRSLKFGELTSISDEFIVYARITYLASAVFTNTGKCAIATGGVSYVIGSRAGLINVTGVSPASHAALSNLDWLSAGHIATASTLGTLASFDAIGTATESQIGGLTESADGLVWSDSTRNVIGGATSLGLKAGRVIPTSTNISHGETAYTNRITSLTTTGSSGASTLVSNTLNVPNYTLAGLGGISSEVDGDVTNEGKLTVSTKSTYSQNINSNTSTSIPVVLRVDSIAPALLITSTANKISLKADTTYLMRKATVASLYIPKTQRGANNGVATLDAGGKVPFTQLPASLMIYKGLWTPSTNLPALADGTGISGWVYKVTADGSANLGSGVINYLAGDFVIHNGTNWERSVGTDNVVSVNGQQGVVTLTTANIAASTNKNYVTDAQQSNLHNPTSDNQTLTIAGTTSPTIALSGSNTATFSAGTGITLGQSLGTITVTNSAPDTNTTYDHLATTATGGANIRLHGSDGSTDDIKLANGTGITATYTDANTITLANTGVVTEIDGSTTNELQTLNNTSDATSHTVTLSNSGGSAQLVEGSGISLTTTGTGSAGIITVANTGVITEVDGSTANEIQTLTYTPSTRVMDISLSATDATLPLFSTIGTDAGLVNGSNGATTSFLRGDDTWQSVITTEVDGSVTNEGQLTTVGTTNNATIHSNTSGSTDLNVKGAGTSTVTSSGANITVTSNDQYVGTVTSVAALTLGTTGTDLSSTAANSTTTPVITLQVPTASATNRGALSSTDWSTFNGKAPSSGSANYIHNQNASAQSAYMWIGGTGVFGGLLKAYDNFRLPTNTAGIFFSESGFDNGIYRDGNDTKYIATNGTSIFNTSIQATTAKLTNLTDGYIPYHISDASGLGDSPIYTDGTNVGIGTTAPYTKLDVFGDTRMGQSHRVWASSLNGHPNYGGVLYIINDIGSTQGAVRLRATYAGVGTSGNPNFAIDRSTNSQAYDLNPSSLTYVNSLTIDGGNGNVGIGTTAPNAKLHVNGIGKFGRTSDDTRYFNIDAQSGFLQQYYYAIVENQISYTGDNTWFGASSGVSGTGAQLYLKGSTGNVGIGTTSPTAKLHLAAGTATASTAPLKFTSGALLTVPEAGAVEFLTDTWYGTITTGAARKEFAFKDYVDGKVTDAVSDGVVNIAPSQNAVYDALQALPRYNTAASYNASTKVFSVTDGGGTVSDTIYSPPVVQNFGTTENTAVTWAANAGLDARITLSGATVITMQGLVAGTSGNLVVTNPAGVALTLDFAGYTNKIARVVWSATNRVLTSGSSKVDVYSWYYNGYLLIWNGGLDYK